MESVIKVENVSKKFKLYYDRPLTLKERVVRGSKGAYKEFYAIKDVSFEIKKGSTVGLIGQNGSGKSTMLKMINRTMFPNSGSLKINGKVASLIELGAGFHPELSGRENIYNNASVFGFTKEEIEKRIPDIIRFSELEEFIDNPIRTYSSGMYARLAFSVAIHVDADILLVDEILGVGDMNFQSKCANKIYDMKKQGITILVVTHDMSTIDRLCDYAIWLEHGKKVAEGDPKDIQNKYLEYMSEKQEERKNIESDAFKEGNNSCTREIIDDGNNTLEKDASTVRVSELGEHFGTGEIIITSFKMLNESNTEKRSFRTGETVKLVVNYKSTTDIKNMYVNIGLEIRNNYDIYVYGTNTMRDGLGEVMLKTDGSFEFCLEQLNLLPGEYKIGVALGDPKETMSYDHYHNLVTFKMYSNVHDIGLVRIQHKFNILN